MVSITAAYVDGRPIPRSSSSLTRLASVYRAGGFVSCVTAASSVHATALPSWSAGPVAGRADRFVCFLRVLHLAAIRAGFGRQILVAVLLTDRGTRRGDGLVRQVRAVGSHVCDVAALVQPLGDRHGARGRKPELAAALLLEGRSRERRLRPFRERARINARDAERGVAQARRQTVGGLRVEKNDIAAR